MKILNTEIESINADVKDSNGGTVKFLLLILQAKYLLAILTYMDMHESKKPYWCFSQGASNFKFVEFLKSRNVINREFTTPDEVEESIFPLIHKFLEDKPDDYLERQQQSA